MNDVLPGPFSVVVSPQLVPLLCPLISKSVLYRYVIILQICQAI